MAIAADAALGSAARGEEGKREKKGGTQDGCAHTHRRDRAADAGPVGDVQRCKPGQAETGGTGPHPPCVPAGP